LLPLERAEGSSGCSVRGGCSLAGDARVDENIALLTMHTLWVREHNRIAAGLKELNPGWNDKRIFENARKITGGVWQQITFKEYLPILITLPRYTGYKVHVDPSIVNVFLSAAFRFGHSLVPNKFSQLDNNFNKANPPIPLQEAFNNRHLITTRGIEQTIRGLIGNLSNNVDNKFSFGLARRLFVSVGSEGYLDLTALNIQRGRDHGLPGYNEYRRFCGLPVATTWARLRNILVAGAASKFEQVYKHPDDIDVFAGGISEKHIGNSIVGPTFNCILKQQFQKLRDGDRFYYENPGVFTVSQLNALKKTKMSSVLCENLKGLVSIQPNAFFTPKKRSNTRKVCNSIPKLDLSPWKDNSAGDEPEERRSSPEVGDIEENDWEVVDGASEDMKKQNDNHIVNLSERLSNDESRYESKKRILDEIESIINHENEVDGFADDNSENDNRENWNEDEDFEEY